MKLITSLIGDVFALCKRYIIITVLTLVVVKCGKPASAQTAPLQIGDKLPAIALKNIANNKDSALHLVALKGSPLLLVFWNSSCRASRRQLQQIDSLHKSYGRAFNVLALATEVDASAHIRSDTLLKNLSLPLVTGETALHQQLPHRIRPHVVWVWKDGSIRHITHAEYVDDSHLKAFLDQTPMEWPHKQDRTDFKPGKHSLLAEQKGSYSIVSPYMPGLSPGYKVWTDSLTGNVHTQVINFSVYRLYLLALGRLLGVAENHHSWEGADPANYRYQAGRGYREEWNRRNSYCYESVLPASLSGSQRMEKMRNDLNVALGLNIRLEGRDTTVWALEATGSLPHSKGGRAYSNMQGRQPQKKLVNAGLSTLTWQMNKYKENAPVQDDTGYTGTLDMELSIPSFTDIPAINRELERYNLVLRQKRSKVSYLVIAEQ